MTRSLQTAAWSVLAPRVNSPGLRLREKSAFTGQCRLCDQGWVFCLFVSVFWQIMNSVHQNRIVFSKQDLDTSQVLFFHYESICDPHGEAQEGAPPSTHKAALDIAKDGAPRGGLPSTSRLPPLQGRFCRARSTVLPGLPPRPLPAPGRCHCLCCHGVQCGGGLSEWLVPRAQDGGCGGHFLPKFTPPLPLQQHPQGPRVLRASWASSPCPQPTGRAPTCPCCTRRKPSAGSRTYAAMDHSDALKQQSRWGAPWAPHSGLWPLSGHLQPRPSPSQLTSPGHSSFFLSEKQ